MTGPNKVSKQQNSLQSPEQSGAEKALVAKKEQYRSAQEQFKQSRAAFDALSAEYRKLVASENSNEQQNQQDYIKNVTAEADSISNSVPDVTELISNDQVDMLLRKYNRSNNMIGAISKELQEKIVQEKQAQEVSTDASNPPSDYISQRRSNTSTVVYTKPPLEDSTSSDITLSDLDVPQEVNVTNGSTVLTPQYYLAYEVLNTLKTLLQNWQTLPNTSQKLEDIQTIAPAIQAINNEIGTLKKLYIEKGERKIEESDVASLTEKVDILKATIEKLPSNSAAPIVELSSTSNPAMPNETTPEGNRLLVNNAIQEYSFTVLKYNEVINQYEDKVINENGISEPEKEKRRLALEPIIQEKLAIEKSEKSLLESINYNKNMSDNDREKYIEQYEELFDKTEKNISNFRAIPHEFKREILNSFKEGDSDETITENVKEINRYLTQASRFSAEEQPIIYKALAEYLDKNPKVKDRLWQDIVSAAGQQAISPNPSGEIVIVSALSKLSAQFDALQRQTVVPDSAQENPKEIPSNSNHNNPPATNHSSLPDLPPPQAKAGDTPPYDNSNDPQNDLLTQLATNPDVAEAEFAREGNTSTSDPMMVATSPSSAKQHPDPSSSSRILESPNVGAVSTVSASTSSQPLTNQDIAKQNFINICKEYISLMEAAITSINNISYPARKTSLDSSVDNIHNNYNQFLDQIKPHLKQASSQDFQKWTEAVKQYTAEMAAIRNKAITIAQVKNNLINSLSAFLEVRRQWLETLKKLPTSSDKSQLVLQGLAIIKKYNSLRKHINSETSASDINYSNWKKYVERYTSELHAVNTAAHSLLATFSSTEAQQQTSSTVVSATAAHEIIPQRQSMASENLSSLTVRTGAETPEPSFDALSDLDDLSRDLNAKKEGRTSPGVNPPTNGEEGERDRSFEKPLSPTRRLPTRQKKRGEPGSSTNQNDAEFIKTSRKRLEEIGIEIEKMRTTVDKMETLETKKYILNQSISTAQLSYESANRLIGQSTPLALDELRTRVMPHLESAKSSADEAIKTELNAISARDSNTDLEKGNTKKYQEIQQLYEQYTEVATKYSQMLQHVSDTQKRETSLKNLKAHQTILTDKFTALKNAYEQDAKHSDVITLYVTLKNTLQARITQLTTELKQLETEISESANPATVSNPPELEWLNDLLKQAQIEKTNLSAERVKQEYQEYVDNLFNFGDESHEPAPSQQQPIVTNEDREARIHQKALPTPPSSKAAVNSPPEPDNNSDVIGDLDELLDQLDTEKQTRSKPTATELVALNAKVQDELLQTLDQEAPRERIVQPQRTSPPHFTAMSDEELEALLGPNEGDGDSGQRSPEEELASTDRDSQSSPSSRSSIELPQPPLLQPLLPTHIITANAQSLPHESTNERIATSRIGALVPNWVKNAWHKLTSFLPTIRRAGPNDAVQQRGSSETDQGSIRKSPPAESGDLEKSLNRLRGLNTGNLDTSNRTSRSRTSTDARLLYDLGSEDSSTAEQRESQSPPPSRPGSGIPIIPAPPPESNPSSRRSSRSNSSVDPTPSSSPRGSFDGDDSTSSSNNGNSRKSWG